MGELREEALPHRRLTGRRVWLLAGVVALTAVVILAALLIPDADPVAGGTVGGPVRDGRPQPGGAVTTPGPAVLELPRVPWEGGPAYYSRFPAAAKAGWTDPRFFPVGVWFEAVVTQDDVDLDRAAGLNTYFELTESTDMSLVRANGMFAFISKPLAGYGKETVGWLLSDEVDMWARGGDAPWTGNQPGEGEICEPPDAGCGYTVLRALTDRLPHGDGRMRYTNFGKGVMMWLPDGDAAHLVNDYTDLVSTDIYWYTDGNICQEAQNFLALPAERCRLAASYGSTVDRTRQSDAEDGRRQPVLAFVQTGWPAEGDHRAIEPDQLTGAVMNSLIHEARGIIYFNHNFGGPCITQHVLRDQCGAAVRPAVTEVNRRIAELAPVLNTQSYEYTFNPVLDTMLKEYNGSFYVFAMLSRGAALGGHVFTLPEGLRGAKAEVLYENRSIDIFGGRFADSFNTEHAYHIYKITP
ncbi:MAG TPA: hypothetical protein VFQ77_03125 [Pseudonocardiaceae bacterium]|jgi:hypothetical protein|nr:hypothetical protein [Pseudonocardiaceae bacterium]